MEQQQYRTVDKFDRLMGALASLPDVAQSKPATVVETTPLIGATQTFIVQTMRQVERDVNSKGEETTRSRDTVFFQCGDDSGLIRMAIPQKVIDAIIRQREALTTKLRRKIGREQAAARKARGEMPGFMKRKKQ